MDRALNLIKKTRDNLDFNLNGLTIMTELGSNNYIYSPLIPLICGADRVIAFVKDTVHGKSEELRSKCLKIAKYYNLDKKLEINTNVFDNEWLKECDIVTNSGMLRPFDSKKLSKFKKGAVLPLMFESWEIRDQDIDISYCKKNNIKVAGTWESHPDINVFNYIKVLCLKMVFEAGFEVLNNKIYVWSNDEFGMKIKNSFDQNGAKICILDNDVKSLFKNVKNLDFIFLADYKESRDFFDLLRVRELLKINPNLAIIHLYGNLDLRKFNDLGIKIYPNKNGISQTMTFTLAHVGLIPIINLQVAGYKVATEMINNKYTSLSQIIIK